MICTGRQVLRKFTTHWADFSRKQCDERILRRTTNITETTGVHTGVGGIGGDSS